MEWPFSAWTQNSIVLSGVAIIALSLAASFAFVLGKAYIQVRNFDGPPCHWIKGNIDQVIGNTHVSHINLPCLVVVFVVAVFVCHCSL